MNKEFFAALELLYQEKGIPKEYMLEKVEAALVSAYKKEYGSLANVRIIIDESKEDVKVFQQREVVEEVINPICEISLDEAKTKSKKYKVGDILETEVKTKNFRRLSAGAAKSVIIQGIREGERKVMQEAYESKREEIINATVSKTDPLSGNILLETGTSYATLLRSEQIPGEVFTVGDRILVYVVEVNKDSKGPIVTLSRKSHGFVRRMFELEVPEIQEGIVIIKGVSREAGSRTKLSVFSRDEDVDPVGACIGNHSMRISNIIDELRGEKIDIIKYSEIPEEYIAAALAPATVNSVEIVEERSAKVLVDADQLSLAIGKEGQNARLAARLTGFKIDIKSEW